MYTRTRKHTRRKRAHANALTQLARGRVIPSADAPMCACLPSAAVAPGFGESKRRAGADEDGMRPDAAAPLAEGAVTAGREVGASGEETTSGERGACTALAERGA